MNLPTIYGVDRGSDGFGQDLHTEHPMQFSFFRSLWRRKWIVILCVVLGTVVGVLRTFYSKPKFRSEASLFVRHTALVAVGDQGTSYSSNLQTQSRIIASSGILSTAVAKVQASCPKTFFEPNALATMFTGLGVNVGGGTDVISLSFEGPDPVEASVVLQGIVDSYIEFHRDRRVLLNKESTEEQSRLESQMERKRKDIGAMQEKLGVVGDAFDASRKMREELGSVKESLQQAKMDADSGKSAYEDAKQRLNDPLSSQSFVDMLRLTGALPANDASITALREQKASATAELRRLNGDLLANHPRVQAASKQATALEAALAEAEKRQADGYIEALRLRSASAQRQSTALQNRYDELMKLGTSQHRDFLELERQDSDLKRMERQLETVSQKVRENASPVEAAMPAVQVVEPPSINAESIGSKPLRIVAIGSFSGMGLGIFVALMMARFDTRVRNASELMVATRLPVVASVPRVTENVSPELLGKMVELQPVSAFAEACRAVRTAIFFSAKRQEPRTILVTSSSPGEGKSTMASNLAIAMARSGRRVLLLDADLRKPVQHRIFQAEPQGDLADLLRGDQSIERAVQPCEIENLSLLLCSSLIDNPSELLNSVAFSTLLEDLTRQFSHIVIDSPPVGVATDARILSALSDVSILVVRAGTSTRNLVTRSTDALTSVGGNVLGLVLNHSVETQDRFGSYGYYQKPGDRYRSLDDANVPDERQPTRGREIPTLMNKDSISPNPIG